MISPGSAIGLFPLTDIRWMNVALAGKLAQWRSFDNRRHFSGASPWSFHVVAACPGAIGGQ